MAAITRTAVDWVDPTIAAGDYHQLAERLLVMAAWPVA